MNPLKTFMRDVIMPVFIATCCAFGLAFLFTGCATKHYVDFRIAEHSHPHEHKIDKLIKPKSLIEMFPPEAEDKVETTDFPDYDAFTEDMVIEDEFIVDDLDTFDDGDGAK